jgi:SAM-dependent methyltransferase
VTATRVDCSSLAAVYGHRVDLYDGIWSPVIRPAGQAVIGALDLGDARRVFDVGAGTGALSGALRAAAPRATVVAVDTAPAMLRYARDRRGVTAVLGDATALPARDGSVDAVLLAYVLFHLLDPLAGLREAARAVRRGGRIGTVTWANESPARAAQVFEDTLAELDVPPLPAHGNHAGLETADAIDALLDKAGLCRRDVWLHAIEHTFEPDDLWQLRTNYGASAARLGLLDPNERGAVLREARRRLESLTRSDYTFRGEVVCAVGRRT